MPRRLMSSWTEAVFGAIRPFAPRRGVGQRAHEAPGQMKPGGGCLQLTSFAPDDPRPPKQAHSRQRNSVGLLPLTSIFVHIPPGCGGVDDGVIVIDCVLRRRPS